MNAVARIQREARGGVQVVKASVRPDMNQEKEDGELPEYKLGKGAGQGRH